MSKVSFVDQINFIGSRLGPDLGDMCSLCKYECKDGGVKNYGGGPEYPPCADADTSERLTEILDENAVQKQYDEILADEEYANETSTLAQQIVD